MADPANPHFDPPGRKSTSSPSPGPSNGGTINLSHRSSFAENLRHSPRSQRHPSFTQSAVQELLNHPPAPKTSDSRFVGRDWRQIRVGELIENTEVRWAELDVGVEQATKVSFTSIAKVALVISYSSWSTWARQMLFSSAKSPPIRVHVEPSITAISTRTSSL